MRYPYLISSDQHAHAWSAFSQVDTDGVNSRLRIILNEIERSADVLKSKHDMRRYHGEPTMFLAGDLFHQRGEIKPSVFNPTVDTFRKLLKGDGTTSYKPPFNVVAIPGNHDLEGRDASSLGNAMQALDSIDGFHVACEPERVDDVVVFPWYQDLNELRARMRQFADPNLDAIIHAPVNGVIKGLPDHGLEASELAALGFRRVFAGHYHDHKVMGDGKVVSIGATSHQTWSDPGTKAGFLLVYEDRIEHVPSQAPEFVDLTPELIDAADAAGFPVEELVKGNYVRIKLQEATDKEKAGWKKDVLKAGALDCLVMGTSKTAVTRSGAASKAAVSLASSVEHYVRNDMKPLLIEEVSREAQLVLTEAQT